MTKKLPLNTILTCDVIEGLKSLPKESIDLTVTSPPYNKKKKHTYGWLVNSETYSHFDDHLPELEYQKWQISVLNYLYKITKPGGSLFYNHKLRWDDGLLIHPLSWISKSKWVVKQEIVWDRGLAANMRGWRFWQVDERIYWLYKPENGYLIGKELESRHAKFSSIWRIKPEPRLEEHPAPFPIEIPTRIIYSLIKEPNSVIFDPFCGTGSTLAAAKILNHNYLGLDISPVYVEYTKSRLDNADKEKARIEKECSQHLIDDSFKSRKEKGNTKWPFGPKPNKKGDSKSEDDPLYEIEEAILTATN